MSPLDIFINEHGAGLSAKDEKKLEEVINVGRECILKRIQLWDAIHNIIV